jgi:hypothetical protein
MKKLKDYRTRNERKDLLVVTGKMEGGTFEYRTNVTEDIYMCDHKQLEELVTDYVNENHPTAMYWEFKIEEFKK